MACYLDTSAVVKLVVAETESAALLTWLQAPDRVPVTSDLCRTELLRAVRGGAPERIVRAREVLDSLTVLQLSTAIFERAATLQPAALRSLDAVHLASALELGDDLRAVVTYDYRQADAAAALAIYVAQPGRDTPRLPPPPTSC
ncbi:type II toxin-antitoxin system VapC family toxin [Microbacterium sp. bgisy207]|uniref:type II toxin-antitoxin system VapC family toxin n=1 Tax=Microbacterium sp. bgisy207 TaxID=3413800 RepID=UPI003EBBA946